MGHNIHVPSPTTPHAAPQLLQPPKGSLATSDAFDDDSPPPSPNDQTTRRTDFPHLPVLSPVLDGRITTAEDLQSGKGKRLSVAIRVQFHIHYVSSYGENLVVVGDAHELGSWDIAHALPLKVTSEEE